MAWANSKVFGRAARNLGAGVFNLTSDSAKLALYVAGMTPDNTVTTDVLTEYNGAASQWVTANEVSGTGYTAGGTAISSPTWTQTSATMAYASAGSPQWTTATITSSGGLVYDTTAGSGANLGLCFTYFGGSQSVTGGTFTVNWNASGIFTIAC